MESRSPLNAADAATALQQVHSGRRAAARRISTPWWYHPLVGLTLAVMLASGSLTAPYRVLLLTGTIAALVGLFWLYRRLTGLLINLLQVPGMRNATLLATGVALGVFALATWLEDGVGARGSLVVAGVLLGVLYTLYWRWAERQLVRLWQTAP